ncbi:MAG: peptidoglycan-binding protein [Acidimicrobiales bacterium]
MGRQRMAAVAIGTVVVIAVGGFVIGASVSSPADVAARTAAPEPSLIMVPVEERVLSADVVSRGTGRFGSPQKLSLASSSLKSAPGITATTALVGTDLAEGDVVVSASGRPVFLLTGPVPMSRDLGPGTSGDDVRQLEEALLRLGANPGSADGVYDDATEAAVAAWYGAKGFAPFSATAEQLGAVRARAADALTASVDALSAGDTVAAAQSSLVASRAALQNARARAQWAARAVEQVAAQNVAANAVVAADVAVKQAALDALVAGGVATPQELALARSDLALSVANRDAVRFGGVRTQDETALAAAEANADIVVKEAALVAADTTLANSQQASSARTAAADLTAQERNLALSRAGIQVPADEVVFVASSPVRVAELLVGPGDPAAGAIARVSDALVHVEAGVAVGDAGLVKPGMKAKIEEPDLGIATEGVVTVVAPGPGTNGMDGFHVYVEISVAAPPPNLVGASVRVTIPVQSSDGAVLAVPVSALTLAPDGSSRLQRSTGRGDETEYITVLPGLSAQGYVTVTTLDGDLKKGDLVVVGVNQTGAADANTADANTATTKTTQTTDTSEGVSAAPPKIDLRAATGG